MVTGPGTSGPGKDGAPDAKVSRGRSARPRGRTARSQIENPPFPGMLLRLRFRAARTSVDGERGARLTHDGGLPFR